MWSLPSYCGKLISYLTLLVCWSLYWLLADSGSLSCDIPSVLIACKLQVHVLCCTAVCSITQRTDINLQQTMPWMDTGTISTNHPWAVLAQRELIRVHQLSECKITSLYAQPLISNTLVNRQTDTHRDVVWTASNLQDMPLYTTAQVWTFSSNNIRQM